MKSKAGRPKLDDTAKRGSMLLVRLTQDEKKIVTHKAKVTGKKLSEFVRERLLA